MSGFEDWSGEGAFNVSDNSTDDNLTLSCAAESIREPVVLPYSTAFTTTVTALRALYWLLLIPCGTALNTLVIFLLVKYKKLRTLSFAIALQIVVINLLFTMLILISLVNLLASRWVLDQYTCSIVGTFGSVTTSARTVLLLVLVIDRFLSVFLPFFHSKHDVKIVVSLSIASWSICIVFAILGFVFDCYAFRPFFYLCINNKDCHERCSVLNVYFLVFIVPATIIPVVLYAALFIKAKKAKARITSITAASDVSKREWKATVTFFLLFLSVFLVSFPLFVVVRMFRVIYPDGDFPPPVYVTIVISINLYSLLVVTDPIVIMRNRDVREILNELRTKIGKKFCSTAENEARKTGSKENID